MSRIADAEWHEVGSELEALLREAALIHELQPPVNVQTCGARLDTREIPRALVRDVLVLVPSIEPIRSSWSPRAATAVDDPADAARRRRSGRPHPARDAFLQRPCAAAATTSPPLAPIVFSWLAIRGAAATRLDPREVRDARELRARLAALLATSGCFTSAWIRPARS